MKKAVLVTILVVLLVVIGAHWCYSDRGRFTTEPEFTGLARTVSGNDLVSDLDPSLVLRFDPAFRHVGGQKFVLYGVADTEQHFFVETTPDGALRSVYWVQYEGYLPDNDYTYDYDDSPLRVTLGDTAFYTDAEIVADELAAFGPEVRVVSPEALAEGVRTRLERVASAHAEEGT